jgi:hypothetical protein
MKKFFLVFLMVFLGGCFGYVQPAVVITTQAAPRCYYHSAYGYVCKSYKNYGYNNGNNYNGYYGGGYKPAPPPKYCINCGGYGKSYQSAPPPKYKVGGKKPIKKH